MILDVKAFSSLTQLMIKVNATLCFFTDEDGSLKIGGADPFWHVCMNVDLSGGQDEGDTGKPLKVLVDSAKLKGSVESITEGTFGIHIEEHEPYNRLKIESATTQIMLSGGDPEEFEGDVFRVRPGTLKPAWVFIMNKQERAVMQTKLKSGLGVGCVHMRFDEDGLHLQSEGVTAQVAGHMFWGSEEKPGAIEGDFVTEWLNKLVSLRTIETPVYLIAHEAIEGQDEKMVAPLGVQYTTDEFKFYALLLHGKSHSRPVALPSRRLARSKRRIERDAREEDHMKKSRDERLERIERDE